MPHKKLKRGQLAKGLRGPAAGSPPLYFTTNSGFLQAFPVADNRAHILWEENR
jgi:hypothetical protein